MHQSLPGSRRRRDDNDEAARVERQKGLTTERVIFEMVYRARQLELATCNQADGRARILTGKIDVGKCVIAIGHAVVDREKIPPLEFDHVAKGGESLARQRLNGQGIRHRSCPAGAPG